MSEITKTPRITKAMKFEDIKAILSGEPQPHGIDVKVLEDAMTHELGLLAKKNAAGSDKGMTATQKKNEEYKTQILDILATAPEDGLSCAQIHKQVSYEEPFEVQKTASLLRQLGEDGSKQVVSAKVKGKTMFKLA